MCSECIQAADLSGLWAESLNQEAVTILDAPDFDCNQAGCVVHTATSDGAEETLFAVTDL